MEQLFKVDQSNIPLSVLVNRILPSSEFIEPRALALAVFAVVGLVLQQIYYTMLLQIEAWPF